MKLLLKCIALLFGTVVLLLLCGALLLNHAKDLKLHNTGVRGEWLERWYPSEQLTVLGSRAGNHWYYPVEEQIYRDYLPWQECLGDFVAAVQLSESLVIACSEELMWFDNAGRLLDRVSEEYGLAGSIESLGVVGEQIFIRSANKVYNIDLSSMEFFEALSAANVKWQGRQLIPQEFNEGLQDMQTVSLDQLLTDFYQWLFLGTYGKWLIDILLLGTGSVVVAFLYRTVFRKKVMHEDEEPFDLEESVARSSSFDSL